MHGPSAFRLLLAPDILFMCILCIHSLLVVYIRTLSQSVHPCALYLHCLYSFVPRVMSQLSLYLISPPHSTPACIRINPSAYLVVTDYCVILLTFTPCICTACSTYHRNGCKQHSFARLAPEIAQRAVHVHCAFRMRCLRRALQIPTMDEGCRDVSAPADKWQDVINWA